MKTLLAPILLVAACTAEPPSTGIHIPPYTTRPDAAPQMLPDAGGYTEKPAIHMAPILGSTYWNSVPLHGNGPLGGMVLVDTPAAGAMSRAISSDGNFCVDAPLVASSNNQFVVRGVDRNGVMGDPVTVEVKQDGSPPEPEMAPAAQNMAQGGVAQGSVWEKEGVFASMIDGDPSSSLYMSNAWTGDDWVWVMLRERSNVEMVRVMSSIDCLAGAYTVLTSDDDAPGDPARENTKWKVFGDQLYGNGDDVYMKDAPVSMRHVAIMFWSSDCSFLGHGYHKISEIEAWTPAGIAPPVQRAPSCSGGG